MEQNTELTKNMNISEKKNNEKVAECNVGVFSKLPMDVALDIFSRLPLETISECRWVSKTWYGFILHPRLAEMHFARNPSLPCALFYSRYKTAYLIGPDQCFVNHETSVTGYEFKELKEFRDNFRYGKSWNCFEVVGTVKGLICFSPEKCEYVSSPYYICNPITRDYFMPPKSPKVDIEPLASGFGFDSLNNEYKLLRILRNSSEDGNEVEVFTLGSDSWREITINVPYIAGMGKYNLLLNGCLHWVNHLKIESKCSVAILSFNVATEEFKLIRMPPLSREGGGMLRSFDLIVLGGRLCVMDGGFMTDKEIWVMKDYGVHSSWAKEYVFQQEFMLCIWQGYHQVLEMNNGELLMLNENENLGYYDPKKKTCKTINICNLKNEKVELDTDFPIYLTGSLISPKSIGRKQIGSVTEGSGSGGI